MDKQIRHSLLTRVYVSTLFISLAACIYSYFKPGITVPQYPEKEMKEALIRINSASLISTKTTTLGSGTSDRQVSSLFTYSYDDGSKVLAAIVRVKKRDDFKIETYGLLTKNLEPIYLKSPNFIDSAPYAVSGMIGKKKAIQTCIIPKTTDIKSGDIRLANLTTTLEDLTPHSNTIVDRIVGSRYNIDYSCLVLTYVPAGLNFETPPKEWPLIAKNVQSALLKDISRSKDTF
jgi:hypothetical protein